jgi:hypothetical protein
LHKQLAGFLIRQKHQAFSPKIPWKNKNIKYSMRLKKERKIEDWSSRRLQVEDMKIWYSTRIYNSGRISGATDKGIATKAHYLSTPGARSGSCVIRVRPKYRHSWNTSWYHIQPL